MFLNHFFSLLLACSGIAVSPVEEIPIQQVAALPESDEQTTRIYFIRNGESLYSEKDANGTKFTSGKSPSVPLNRRGIAQAIHLSSLLKSRIENAIIYTPPAVRAEQTASLLVSDEIILGEPSERLFEVGMGVWEGTPKDHFYKNELKKWNALSAFEKYQIPRVETGESYFEASERALVELNKIVEQNRGKTILIVSGENLLNALAIRWTQPDLSHEPGSDLPMLPLDPCDLYLVELPEGKFIEEAQLNRVFHTNLSQ